MFSLWLSPCSLKGALAQQRGRREEGTLEGDNLFTSAAFLPSGEIKKKNTPSIVINMKSFTIIGGINLTRSQECFQSYP